MTINKAQLDSTTKTGRRWSSFARGLFLSATFLMVPITASAGNHRKIAPDVAQSNQNAGDTADVIIQFTQPPTAAHHQKVTSKGGQLKQELAVVNAAAYSVPASALQDLADDPDVVYISPDRKVKGFLDLTAAAVNAHSAWQSGWTGTGIGVAVLDSGISPNADLNGGKKNLTSRIIYSQDFVGGGTGDLYGHGEHVAGVIAASGLGSSYYNYTRTFKGIAPNANLINLRVLDQNGEGTDSAVIAAIQQAINLKNRYNIRVMNLSLGRPVYESYTVDPLCQAVEAAWKAGIVVVAAAGNSGRDNSMGTSGYATIAAPGNDPYVITVGSMKTEGSPLRAASLIASYSSKGPTLLDHVVKPDIVAPGNRVVSLQRPAPEGTLATTYPQNNPPECYYMSNAPCSAYTASYYTLSGTSMATPVVSGAAALLLQAHPTLTPDQVKARLMKTAYKAFPTTSTAVDPVTGALYVSQYDIFTVGAGYLDVGAALANSDLATGSALSPTAVYDSTQNAVYIVTDAGSTWGSSITWGTTIVWGSNVFVNGTSIVWGGSICWGTNTDAAFSLIWGTSIVWGTTSQVAVEAMNVTILGED